MLSYQYKRFFASGRLHLQAKQNDGLPESQIAIINGRAGFTINPAYQLQVYGGLLVRSEKIHNFITAENRTLYFYLSVRTSLYNMYYDF